MKPIPEGYHTVTPVFVFKDSRKALDFYKKAFGAVETFVMPGPDGKGVLHASMKIGNSNIMLSDENREKPWRGAETMGGSPVAFYLYVENADAAFKKAAAAGAVEQMPLQDSFWGDRVGSVKDPFGYHWTFATHTRDLTPQQIAAGAEEAMAQHSGKK